MHTLKYIPLPRDNKWSSEEDKVENFVKTSSVRDWRLDCAYNTQITLHGHCAYSVRTMWTDRALSFSVCWTGAKYVCMLQMQFQMSQLGKKLSGKQPNRCLNSGWMRTSTLWHAIVHVVIVHKHWNVSEWTQYYTPVNVHLGSQCVTSKCTPWIRVHDQWLLSGSGCMTSEHTLDQGAWKLHSDMTHSIRGYCTSTLTQAVAIHTSELKSISTHQWITDLSASTTHTAHVGWR